MSENGTRHLYAVRLADGRFVGNGARSAWRNEASPVSFSSAALWVRRSTARSFADKFSGTVIAVLAFTLADGAGEPEGTA